MNNRKLFTGPILPSRTVNQSPNPAASRPSFAITSISPNVTNMVKDALTQAGIDAAGQVIDAGTNRIVDYITNGGSTQTNSSNGSDGGGGGSSDGNSNSKGHSSGFALTNKPNPKIIRLDTGIKPNTYSTDYSIAEENVCSPLHLTAAYLQIPTDSTTKMYSYFINQMVPDLQSRAQSNVNFYLDISNLFSAAKILTAINSSLNALQIYLFYMSIISYYSLPSNKNEGMTYLRKQITPQMIEDLTNLGRRLADIPMPPNMVEMCRYLSGTFLSGDNQGSPLIKFCPHAMSGGSILDGTKITDAYNAISTSDNIQVYGILRRCIANWIPGIIYDVDPVATFDPNYLTIWANAPHAVYVSTFAYHPQAATEDTTVAYNSFCNNLDGAAFGLMSIYNTTLSKYLPGLLQLPTLPATVAGGNTRRSFYQVAGSSSFWIPKDYPFLTASRPDTYQYLTATTTLSCHMFGTTRCLQVNSNAIRETDFTLLEFILDLNSIAVDRKEMTNPYAKSKRSGPRGPKSKGRKGKFSKK